MNEPSDKVSFTREDLLNCLPILEGLYKCFDRKHVIDWMLKKGTAEPRPDECEKKNEG